MTELVTAREAPIRPGSFFGVPGLTGLWELLTPRRPLPVSRALRWNSNLGVVVLNARVPRETHSNYGFNLPWWGRLPGTVHSLIGATGGATLALPPARYAGADWVARRRVPQRVPARRRPERLEAHGLSGGPRLTGGPPAHDYLEPPS